MKIDYSYLFDYVRRLYSKCVYSDKDGSIRMMPMRYLLELTYDCNLRCPFCYITEDRKKNELTTEQLEKIHGVYQY